MRQELEDEDLRFIIIGALAVVPTLAAFPVRVSDVQRIDNADHQGEAFRIITASGLRFRVDVTYEGSG